MLGADQARLERLLLKAEAESFLLHEADLLDARRFEEWLDLLTEDIKIWMPIVRSVAMDDASRELTREDRDAAWIDEGVDTLRQRAKQLATGVHWAEQPPSRTTRMLANLRVTDVVCAADGAVAELGVSSRFLLYRNRNEDEQDFFIGKRADRLRRVGDAWKLARREILLDQNVLLAKNLPAFF